MNKRILNQIRDVIIDNECMWIITDTLNSLLNYNFCSKELKLISVFPESMRSDFAPFSKIVKIEDEIYFIPRMATDIFCFNLSRNEFYAIHVPWENFQEEKKMDVVVVGKKLYCINRFPDAVIKIDSVTKEVNIFLADTDIKVEKRVESKIYRTYMFLSYSAGKIIWPNYNGMITIFDVETEKFSVKVLEKFPNDKINGSKNFFGIELDDWIIGVKAIKDILCLCTYKGKIYLYNNMFQRIDTVLSGSEENDVTDMEGYIFRNIVVLGDELWFIPISKNQCLRFNIKTKQFDKVLNDYDKKWDADCREYSVYKVLNDKNILLYSYYENCFYIIHKNSYYVNKMEIEFPFERFIKESILFEHMYMSDGIYNIDNLQLLFNRSKYENKDSFVHTNRGKKIFEIVK